MRKLITIILCAVFFAQTLLFVEAKEGVYEYTNEDERNFVENILENRSYTGLNDTSVFEGHPVYLLEENFLENSISILEYDAQPNGWDVDRRGGLLRSDGTRVHLYDGDPENVVSMTHSLMPHRNGDLVLETAMHMKHAHQDGFFIELGGEGNTALRLETKDKYIGYMDKDGSIVRIADYVPDISVPIKAVVHMNSKTIDVIVNGILKQGIPFVRDAECIDAVTLSTSKENEMSVGTDFVHVYINYIVNERFLSTSPWDTPYDWKLNDNRIMGTAVDSILSQRRDVFSYKLTTSSILAQPRLLKRFEANTDALVTEFCVLVPQKYDGIYMSLLSGEKAIVDISVKKNDFVLNGNQVIYKDFVENLWYRFKIVTDTNKNMADIYLNYNKIAEAFPLKSAGCINGIEFSSGQEKNAVLWIDDIKVYEDLPIPSGYPSEPRTVKPKNDIDIGMIMYSMWREGEHFGWDRMSPYEERQPYLGYYTEGIAETADWETKWLLEHGVTFQIFPFCNMTTGTDERIPTPIKNPIRGQALLDGFLVAEYQMDFCIMWSNVSSASVGGIEDFKENILPFWVEYYFKNPYYKTVDNKLLIYSYSTNNIVEALGGKGNFKTALSLMDEEAKKLGFDGVIFVAGADMLTEDVEEYGIYKYRYGWGDSADNAEAVIAGTKQIMEGSFKRYIPSFPQGFNTSPWRISQVGFMTPENMNDMLTFFSDNINKWKAAGNKAGNMLTLTCWNEWGEGHFYAPSRLYGFEYMNAIRDKLTNAGVLKDEQLPSEESFARMSVLYPLGRQTLKLMPDQNKKYTEDELDVLLRIDFSNPADYAQLEIEKSVTNMRNEDGLLLATASEKDPSIFVNGISLDAAKVKLVRAEAWQENGSTFTIYYQTTDDTDMGVRGKRFSGPLMPGGDNLWEVALPPADMKMLTGKITRLRIDPDDNCFGEFKVKYIEILGNDDTPVTVNIDGAIYENNTPIRTIDGKSYMSVYKYFYAFEKTNIVWYRGEERLHIDYKDYSIDMYDGKREYEINGQKKEFTDAPFYADGNFFVPVREFFTEIGFNIGWDGEKNEILLESPAYQKVLARGEKPSAKWEFDIDNYMDGWIYSTSAKKVIVKDGALKISLRTNPVVISIKGLNIITSDYKRAVIRIKNQSDANLGRFYFLNEDFTSFSKDTGYYFDLTKDDNNYKEYVIDLESNQNYKGSINSLRFDMTGQDGAIYIDSIRFEK